MLIEKILFSDIALARRLEGAHAGSNAEYAQTHAERFPDGGAAIARIAGGAAIFVGVHSPLTQALGMGLNGEMTEAEIDELEEFYRSRNCPVNIELAPLVDVSLLMRFAKRNYHLIECTNVFVRELTESDKTVIQLEDVEVREVTSDNVELFARTVAVGFTDNTEFLPMMVELGLNGFHMKHAKTYLGFVNGEAAGGGSLHIENGVASLYGTSTLPQYRGRGVQTALLKARLARAAAENCQFATISTLPGTTSQRNVERHGFRIVYTRVKLLREW